MAIAEYSTHVRTAIKPEFLAPAGDRTCLIAAVENGADAVYFGLQRHNARIRATQFRRRPTCPRSWRCCIAGASRDM